MTRRRQMFQSSGLARKLCDFLIQAPHFVGISTFLKAGHFQIQCQAQLTCNSSQLAANEISLYFLIQIYTSSNDVSRKKFFDSDQKRFFLMISLPLRNLPPFCSPIHISLPSVGLDSSQAKRFGCIFLDRGKCLRDVLQHVAKVADPKKNISMQKILFSVRIAKKRRKTWINFMFVLERTKMQVLGKKFYFKIQGQQYRCLNLDANFYC